MVRRIQSGLKTQTRRRIKFVEEDGQQRLMQLERHRRRAGPVGHLVNYGNAVTSGADTGRQHNPTLYAGDTGWWPWCPYGGPGGQLWVKETFRIRGGRRHPLSSYEKHDVQYRADRDETYIDKYESPLHMPKALSRFTLEITEVRVQRLLDISDADCMAEGVRPTVDGTAADWRHDETGARRTFRQLWQSINGPASWDANPWVWAITFKKVSG
ncbi:hypothetical protein [Pseudoxanthomonas sp. SE1]|uniref:hypothetical protein n=1 Tax=Pseudoxanthomonas sp. SE1 TaxID=1664560 RepID=UPI00240E08B2|nr:hypothetical protein [Pseudoxanthomonas sp. SE1]WFC43198.1 hypothetical protein OY559_06725 [Pseudoxanthomonas sp. SE1]